MPAPHPERRAERPRHPGTAPGGAQAAGRAARPLAVAGLAAGRWLALALSLVGLAAACTPPADDVLSEQAGAGQRIRHGPTLTLGDIEPDEPAVRIRRLQPLADLTAASLADLGVGRGRVVVARTIAEMAELLAAGEVDLFLDSPYPILAAQQAVGGEILLRRWAKGDRDYWSVIVVRSPSHVATLADLAGRVVALQEPHSTTGFLLPMAMLGREPVTLREVTGPTAGVRADEIGYFFSRDEENTVELLLTGQAEVGVISNQDLAELPAPLRRRLVQVATTTPVPRQLVLARPGLPAAWSARIRQLLLELDDADRAAMEAHDPGLAWTWKFDELPEEARQRLTELRGALAPLLAAAPLARVGAVSAGRR